MLDTRAEALSLARYIRPVVTDAKVTMTGGGIYGVEGSQRTYSRTWLLFSLDDEGTLIATVEGVNREQGEWISSEVGELLSKFVARVWADTHDVCCSCNREFPITGLTLVTPRDEWAHPEYLCVSCGLIP